MFSQHATCLQSAYPFGSVYRPFSASSPWNSRPVNPVLDDTKTIPISTMNFVPTVAEGIFSTGVFVSSKTDSPLTVYGSSSSGIGVPDIGGFAPNITIPRWPANTLPASGSDGHCEIFDPISNVIHSFWQLVKVNGTWCTTLYSWTALDGSGWGNPAQFYQGARATGVASSAGLIRKHEVDDGDSQYRHALTLSMTHNGLSNNPPYVWPATVSDIDYQSNYGSIPEGSLLMLPSTFNVSAQLTIPKLRKIAETLKTYGAYVTDRNTGTPYAIFVEIGSNYTLHPNGWSNQAAYELQLIRAALRPLKSCSGYLNGEDKLIDFNRNQNLLSMRGPWLVGSGGPAGYFDTWRQAVVFSNRTVRTVQNNGNGNGYTPVSWAKTVAGQLYNITAVTTGGGQFRLYLNLACRNLSNIDTGNLNNGQSYVFAWPSSYCWGSISAISGVNQESTVSVQMLKVEVPSPVTSSPKPAVSSHSNSNTNSNSTTTPDAITSRNVNDAQLVRLPNVLIVLVLIILSFLYL
ncbi:predicted protein [Naegleria gruberi]|uniref:Predicted protein n=1 Tax=Naegleria gruberi TaxID=5762 RepID=D2VHY0_NAEGR|nr:uncharacterized protein NAEGRDRAFT_68484 [Naegleria gruberi]EFC43494.1 predicted protein [Naegleria gruberi]|eukprot:XP_002676238.1 predicted protein [Naegleria gruberi strain NEG-M]